MNRAERRRQQREAEKAAEKTTGASPFAIPKVLNPQSYTEQKIAQQTGVKIASLKAWTDEQEKRIREEAIQEYQQKLWDAENVIGSVNIMASLMAINKAWGFTNALDRFIDIYNECTRYIEDNGLKKTYEEFYAKTGLEIGFNEKDIEEYFGAFKDC